MGGTGASGAGRPAAVRRHRRRVQVLLALRRHGTHQGGDMGTIGGAIEPGETPWEAAVREADGEAAGLEPAEVQAAESHRYGCVSGWAYVTFAVRVPPTAPVAIRSTGRPATCAGSPWMRSTPILCTLPSPSPGPRSANWSRTRRCPKVPSR